LLTDHASNSEEDGAGRISPLALFHTTIALLRADRFPAFAEPLLTLHKHIAIREHLDDIAQEALGRQRVPAPEHALSGLEFAPALEERELGRALHLAEHLSDGELVVEEEPLHLRRRDRDGARRDARHLAVAYEVDFAALGYGLLGRRCVRAGRGVRVDGLYVDAV
jgi:hypothetical protein